MGTDSQMAPGDTTVGRRPRWCFGVALPILDPIIGIAITIAILFIVKNAAVSVWTRLMISLRSL
jgi:hypothetical protein